MRNLDLHPRTPQDLRRMLARLSEALLQACGAIPFGYGENRLAVAASPCWRDAMRAAAARIRAPMRLVARVGTP